jgi:tungstate transport system substrate-binding protein
VRAPQARRRTTGILCGLLVLAGCGSEQAAAGEGAGGDMILATTTSTQDSGLLDALLPGFEESSGCVPKPVAVGSGQAMAMGERGDADVLLVHSPEAEQEFMTEGNGSSRKPVMHNDFVLVGPPDDPAGIGAADGAAQAMRLIARERAPFASRADDSGTHTKEMSLWRAAGVDPSGLRRIETGQGMGQTLTIAGQKQAYTLSDRGAFLASSNPRSEIVFEGSADLRNPYHVIVVGGAANVACAKEFSRWLRSEPAQQKIAEFGVDQHGEPLFFPDSSR